MEAKTDVLLNKAQTYLRSAAVLFELEDCDSSASRSYFAMFFAAQALLLAESHSLSTRQGIRSAFTTRFIETGRLPERAAEVFERGHDLQEMGDYAHDFAVAHDEAEWLLAESEAFVNSIANMVERNYAD